MAARLLAFVSAVVLLACGEPTAATDSGADAGLEARADASAPAAGPQIPWLVGDEALLEVSFCPLGLPECDADIRLECGPGEAHFPGEAGCQAVGDPCPAGEFAEGLADDGTVFYVSPTAAVGGDGSRASPFAAISAVRWSTLPPGTTVALAKGEYEATIALRPGVTIVGACAAETIIVGLDAPAPSLIRVTARGDRASIRNVWFRDSDHRGVRVEDGRSLLLDGVILEQTRWSGVSATEGADVTLEEVVIRGTRPRLPEEDHGRGINAQLGAQVTGTRVLVVSNLDVGVYASGAGTRVELTDSAILDTGAEVSTRHWGMGVDVEAGAHLSATRTFIAGNLSAGVHVSDEGSNVTLSDVVIRDTQENPVFLWDGRGIRVLGGAALDAERLLVYSNMEVGIFAADRGSAVRLTDVLVSDVLPRSADGLGGRGINIQIDATLEGSRVAVRNTRSYGLLSVLGSSVQIEDFYVEDVARTACGATTCPQQTFGHAVAAASAALRLERFEIRQVESCGVFLGPLPDVEIPTSVDLSVGRVSESSIGVCVQVEGYDLDRLTDDVDFIDNETNLDSTSLPVPEVVRSF